VAFVIPTNISRVCFAFSLEEYQEDISVMASSIYGLSAAPFVILTFVAVYISG
jgi:hypothetical protein